MDTSKLTEEARSSTAIALKTPTLKKSVIEDPSIIDTECSSMAKSIAFDGNPVKIHLVQLTRALCKGLVAVHKLVNCPRELIKFLVRGICRFLSQAKVEKEWVAGAKYLLTFPIARYLGNDEPTMPFGRHFLTHRRYHRWLVSRFSKFSEKNTFFFSSWLQAKRGCEPLSSEMILESFVKHREGMLTKDCGTVELVDKIFQEGSNFRKLMDLVRSRLHKQCRDRRAMNPSPNACFRSCRSSGGQRTDLIARAMGFESRFDDPDAPIDRGFNFLTSRKRVAIDATMYTKYVIPDMTDAFELSYSCQDESLLMQMEYFPSVQVGPRVVSNYVAETRTCGWFFDIEDLLFQNGTRIDHGYDHSPFDMRPMALVAPILEPLKIRLVSAGPGRLYASLKSYQKDLHSVLRNIPLFRLVGRPQNATDLSDLVSTSGNSNIRFFREPLWLSADYSSATDNLSSTVSSRIQEYILKDFDENLRGDALRALGSHRISYPPVEVERWSLEKGEWVPEVAHVTLDSVNQTNGQLMGSIASFPILCLANAAALDLYQRSKSLLYTFEEYLNSALINGDDLVTIVDGKDELRNFKKVSASLGLDLTIGKSYIHPVYANINSAAFHYNLTALQNYLRERCRLVERADEQGGNDYDMIEGYPHTFQQSLPPGIQCPVHFHHLPVPRSVDYFNYGLYSEKHKVQERVGGESENLDVLEVDPEFSTEIYDPPCYDYSNLPPGAQKLLERLRPRLKKRGLSIPKEGDRPYWAVANRVVSGTPPNLREKIQREISRKVHEKGEDIFLYQRTGDKTGKWRWGRRNHRVPISAGGLGLFLDSPTRYYVTNLHRALAKHMKEVIENKGCVMNTQLPKRGPTPKGVSTRHPFSARVQKTVEIPVCMVNDTCTYRFGVTPLVPSGGRPCVV